MKQPQVCSELQNHNIIYVIFEDRLTYIKIKGYLTLHSEVTLVNCYLYDTIMVSMFCWLNYLNRVQGEALYHRLKC